MSSPSTAAYLRSGELALSLPATMQVLSQFRFISKESGEAATTAAQITSSTPPAPALPNGAPARFVSSSLAPSLRSPLTSRPPAPYTAVVPAPRASEPLASAFRPVLVVPPATHRSRRTRIVTPPTPVVRELRPALRPPPPPWQRLPHGTRRLRQGRARGHQVVDQHDRPPASSRPPPGTTASAPARFSSRCRELSPDWSATARRCRSTAPPAPASRSAAAQPPPRARSAAPDRVPAPAPPPARTAQEQASRPHHPGHSSWVPALLPSPLSHLPQPRPHRPRQSRPERPRERQRAPLLVGQQHRPHLVRVPEPPRARPAVPAAPAPVAPGAVRPRSGRHGTPDRAPCEAFRSLRTRPAAPGR